MRKLVALLALCSLSLAGSALDGDHQHEGKAPEQLGKVDFPTTCSAAAQKDFLRGLALLHSFWYPEAEKAFRAAAASDGKCGIAWWGAAASLYHPLWEHPDEATLKQGADAVAAAQKAGAGSERERDYIAAMAAFYNPSVHEYRERAQAWSQAMQQVHERYPQDDEATIFYALSLLATEKPGDREHTNHRRAGALLVPMLERRADHPGVAHYIIHSYDSPELAPLGVPAARRYAQIAPSASHALHMPSHIFERLGMWQDSIKSNIAASDTSREHRKELGLSSGVNDEIHALDFLSYAYEQTGQDAKALAAVERAEKLAADAGQSQGYASEVRATYDVERHDWKAAAQLTPPPANDPRHSGTWWARALGAARSGDAATARKLLEGARREQKSESSGGMRGFFEVSALEIEAWAARAENKNDDAVQMLKSAAEKEQSLGEPGRLPAQALLGDLLLELNRPAEAQQAYEAALAKVPNRFNALYGAARAAELAGQREQARKYYGQFAELCRDADSDRPEVAQARTYLAQR